MKITERNTLAEVTLTKLTAESDTPLEWSEGDERTVLVVSASSATTLTVKAGNGIQGATSLVLSVPVGTSLLKLDSGAYKNVSGNDKGRIVVRSTGTPSVGIAVLK